MPALHGLVQADDAPVSLSCADRMGQALGNLGGRYEDPERKAILGARGGVFAREGPLVLVGTLRLDNRRDLPPAATEAQVVLAAWRRWGEDALARLEGSFALALWDEAERRLWCATDFLASRPLYFRHDGGRLAVASEPRALLAAGAPCRLNLRKFALMGTLFGAARDDETLFKGIRALRAATLLRFDAGGLRIRPYWSADRLGRITGPRSDGEWVEACREAFDEAVRCRMPAEGPCTVMLSGGLDSSAVAATVADLAGRPAQAVSSVFREGEDERGFVRLLGDRVRPRFVTCEGRGPFDDLGRLVWRNGSPLATSRHYVYSALAEAAGGGVLLDGILGEFGPSDHGRGWLAAALTRGQALPALREVLHLARAGEGSPVSVAWRELVRPFLPWRLLRALGRGGETGLLPLRPTFMREVLRSELDEALRWTGRVVNPGPDPRVRLRRIVASAVGGFAGRFVGDEAVEVSYPFLDRRLLDVCLSAPPLLRVRGGLRRSLLRAMMTGRLPDGIRLRRDKGPFSPGYAVHYESQRGRVPAFLDAIPPGHLAREALDLEAAARIAARPPSGPADPGALFLVPSTVYAAVFLENFPRFADAGDDQGRAWEQP